jgi:hypothetical protein
MEVFSILQNIIAFVLPKDGHVDKNTKADLVAWLKAKLPWYSYVVCHT